MRFARDKMYEVEALDSHCRIRIAFWNENGVILSKCILLLNHVGPTRIQAGIAHSIQQRRRSFSVNVANQF